MKLAVFGSLQNFNTEIYSNTFLPFNKTHVLTCNLTPLNMKAKNEGKNQHQLEAAAGS